MGCNYLIGVMRTPILLAAKRRIQEMVEIILDRFPIAIQDMNKDHKNIVLLAAEHKHPEVLKLILKSKFLNDRVLQAVDKKFNNALHLAAKPLKNQTWDITGTALKMQWEIKWFNIVQSGIKQIIVTIVKSRLQRITRVLKYEESFLFTSHIKLILPSHLLHVTKFVKESMSPHISEGLNNDKKTPRDVFSHCHKDFVEESASWVFNTSQSCSVVAAIIATVAFATAYTVPRRVKEDSGFPTLQGKPTFDVFAASSLVALCFSLTSLVMFLSILTSRNKESDFGMHLPLQLILGLSSLFISITSMLVSFCAGQFLLDYTN